MAENRIIGVDLGFRSTGLVAAVPDHSDAGYSIDRFVCIKTEKAGKKKAIFVAQDDVQQCQNLFNGVMEFIRQFDPTALAVELPTAGAKGARANRGMGIATGMAASVAAITGLPVIWVYPEDSKKLVGGKKNASKDDMMDAIRNMWPQEDWPKTKNQFEHIADAAAALLVAKYSDIYKFMRGNVNG